MHQCFLVIVALTLLSSYSFLVFLDEPQIIEKYWDLVVEFRALSVNRISIPRPEPAPKDPVESGCTFTPKLNQNSLILDQKRRTKTLSDSDENPKVPREVELIRKYKEREQKLVSLKKKEGKKKQGFCFNIFLLSHLLPFSCLPYHILYIWFI